MAQIEAAKARGASEAEMAVMGRHYLAEHPEIDRLETVHGHL